MLWVLFTVSSTCHVSVNTCTLNKSKSTSAGLRFDSSFIFSVNFLILNSQIFFIQCLFHARASFLHTFLMYEELFHVSQSMSLHEETHVITREWSKRKIPSGLGKFCEHVAWFSGGPRHSQPRTLSPRATWTGESGYWTQGTRTIYRVFASWWLVATFRCFVNCSSADPRGKKVDAVSICSNAWQRLTLNIFFKK